ncbi:hypothetical protein M9Y10_044989 [Tritrichomonas musculus]|uniref:TPR Domain containing protein n=1 Tax=Tritrichomonas musculus TaxID=1915356 RepID=A0ABR2JVV9_9EUKA
MSTTLSLAGAQQRKEFGVEKMKHQRYEDAIQDFKMVVENFLVDNDQKAGLKMLCYNQMALCYIELGDYTQATIASGEAITLFDLMRPGELEKKVHRKNDPLFQHFHTSFVRRGQIFEKQKKYQEALNEYRKALALTSKGEANQRIQDVLVQFGIPPVDQNDPKLKPFSDVLPLENLFNSEKLTESFRGIIDVLGHSDLTREQLAYIDQSGVTQALLGILNFHMKSELLVDIALTVTNFLDKNGCTHSWANADVLIAILNEYHDNSGIISDLLTTFACCPKEKYGAFARKDVFDHLLEAFDLELKEDELDGIFYFMFNILTAQGDAIAYLEGTKILDYAMKKRTLNSMLIISRLSLSPSFIEQIKVNGAIDWAFEFLNESNTSGLNIGISTLILRQVQTHPEENEKFKIEEFADRCFTEIMPAIKANTKNFKNMNDLLEFMIPLVKISPKSVGPSNIILAASAALAVNNENAGLILTCLSFLYECAHQGLIQELSSSKLPLSSVMKTLEKFPKNQTVVEKTVGFACLMNHPNKEKLLQAALMQFPKSDFLKPFTHILTQYALPQNTK